MSYESVHFRDLFKDLDLLLIQCCSVLLGPYTFLRIGLHKFELLPWLTSEKGIRKTEELENTVKMLEEFLKFVVIISTERTKSGWTDEQLIR
jgi:hypothetical protein